MTILLEGEHARGGNVLRITFPINMWPIQVPVRPEGTVGHPHGQGSIPHLLSLGETIRGFPLGSEHFFNFVVYEVMLDLLNRIFYIQISSDSVCTGVQSNLNEHRAGFRPTEDIKLFGQNGWLLEYDEDED